jgi:integrase
MKCKRRSKPGTVTVGNVKVRIYTVKRPTAIGKMRTTWEVADYTSGQRRFRVFTDETEARREAERIARQLSTGEATAASFRNADAASFGRALELLRPSGISLEVAVATYAKALDILGGDAVIDAAQFYARHRVDKITRRTVAETVAELIEAKTARGKSKRYLGDLRIRLARFAGDFAVDISTITGPDVQGWLDRLKVAPQTAKNCRTVLYTLFSFAESRGYIFKGSNPVADTESISTNGGGTIEIYTPSEMDDLLRHAPANFLPFIALGGFAGLRTAEIERLDWQDVDLAGGFIHVAAEKSKTRSRRLVPILPNLARWLAPFALQSGRVWTGTPQTIRDRRADTCKAANVPWKNNALRHSFISYRLADIQNAAQVALEAGNSPAMVFRHYRELVKPDAAKTWFAIAPEAPANVLPMAKEVAR